MIRSLLVLTLMVSVGCGSDASGPGSAAADQAVLASDGSSAVGTAPGTAARTTTADQRAPESGTPTASRRSRVPADTTDALRLLSIARQLDRDGDLEEAEGFYRNALDRDPENLTILTDLGYFLLRVERPEEALPVYQRAVDLDSRDATARNGLAATLMALDRHDEAVEHAQSAVDLRADYVDAMNNLGVLRARFGDIEGALEILRPAALLGRDQGDLRPILSLGIVALESERWDEAIRMIGYIVTRNPNHADMRVLLARAMIGNGQPVSALAQVNAGLKANPDHAASLALKAQLEANR